MINSSSANRRRSEKEATAAQSSFQGDRKRYIVQWINLVVEISKQMSQVEDVANSIGYGENMCQPHMCEIQERKDLYTRGMAMVEENERKMPR